MATQKCPWCGKEFDLKDKKSKYCSEECRRQTRIIRQREIRAERAREREAKEKEAPINEYGVQMHKTSEAYCKQCVHHNVSVRCCDFYENTGIRRGCPIGWCDKFERKQSRKKPKAIVIH